MNIKINKDMNKQNILATPSPHGEGRGGVALARTEKPDAARATQLLENCVPISWLDYQFGRLVLRKRQGEADANFEASQSRLPT